MRLTTHYHHTRYEENGSEGKFSLRMPRRKSSVFKPPVLIQFQVTADIFTRACSPTSPPLESRGLQGSRKMKIPSMLPLLSSPLAYFFFRAFSGRCVILPRAVGQLSLAPRP